MTLGLRITGVRDDGYHLIDAEMVSLDLHDLITVDTRRPPASPHPDRSPTGCRSTTRNLVARAAAAARHRRRRRHPPPQADPPRRRPRRRLHRRGHRAALGRARHRHQSELQRAAALGADIPFCLVGGRARVRGIGEIVEPLPHVDRVVTLVIPPLGVSTPAAYRAWDDLGGPLADGPNDLEPAALAVEPELGVGAT